MLTNKGFTLVETLFVLSIIIVLSTFTLSYAINNKPQISFEQQCTKIRSLLEEAKTKALITHQKVDIEISSETISYQDEAKDVIVELADGYYFKDYEELYFNRNGNINSGNHFDICNQETCKSIIFNVGSGAFYVQ